MKKAVFAIFKILLAIAYPILVFGALSNGFSPRMLSLLLILAALFQFKSQKIKPLRNIIFIGAVLLFSGLWLYNNEIFLKLYPVLMSLSFLAVFLLSIKFPPTVIEKFARMKNKELPEYAIIYCSKVTIIWCIFFAFNAIVAFYTTFLPIDVWVLYNGLISYLIIGTIMAAEFIFRTYCIRRKNRHVS